MGEPNWKDIMKFDGRVPEPPYDTPCPSCAAKDAAIAEALRHLAPIPEQSALSVVKTNAMNAAAALRDAGRGHAG